ncbi:4'-phosphopantetheinyl transferase superfamily protein [Actinocorallia cavernae]|uniref:4'-phosphopantetheinyl transferase superfamily protein n=2 Tax=Actinomycetes TaxID=1760 RepID=A0ABN3MMX7_9ACTN
MRARARAAPVPRPVPRPVPDRPLPEALDLPEPGAAPHLWLVRTDGYAPGAAGVALLSPAEARRRAAFGGDIERHRYTVAHVVLRRLLGGYLRQAPAKVPISPLPCASCGAPGGRPGLPGSTLHFSLSHCADLALFAFARGPVGVDVEALPERGTVDGVLARLHPEERAELAALPPGGRERAFVRCWTRKEAYLKGTGAGLAHGLGQPYTGSRGIPASVPGWRLADVEVDPGYGAAVADSVLQLSVDHK